MKKNILFIIVAVIFTVVSIGCNHSPSQQTNASQAFNIATPQNLEQTLTGKFDEQSSTEAALNILAQSGVEVFDDQSFSLIYKPTGPVSYFKYTKLALS